MRTRFIRKKIFGDTQNLTFSNIMINILVRFDPRIRTIRI
jgi:hypothetical protein